MKIAALIIAHHKPALLKRLTDALQGDLWNRYVHIDAKADLETFASATNAAVLIAGRASVYWGTNSIVEATLKLMSEAVKHDENTHFYLMSGQCFPIKTDACIRDALSNAKEGGNFIHIVEMPERHKPLERLSQWHFNKQNCRLPRRLRSFLTRVLPRRDVGRLLNNMKPYAGGTWWLLERRCVEAMLGFIDANPYYLKAFKYSFCSDEMFFQTLFKHLGFAADNGSPTATRWIDGSPHPETVTPEIHEQMTKSWRFMARKFDESFLPPLMR